MQTIWYNQYNVRIECIKHKAASKFNWLFVPGGPGFGSDYLKPLVNKLTFDGSVFLIDLPNNGDNMIYGDTYNFEEWLNILYLTIAQFENPIVVGHSCGGMLLLLLPQLDKIIKGIIFMSSSPVMWTKRELIASDPVMSTFLKNPSQQTFKFTLDMCAQSYFHSDYMLEGKGLLDSLKCNHCAAFWWLKRVIMFGYDAAWEPTVPMLIINGENDMVTPYYNWFGYLVGRVNNNVAIVPDAGHFPWIENMEFVKDVFEQFAQFLCTSSFASRGLAKFV